MSAESWTPDSPEEDCPNGCHLSFYGGTHQGPPDCDRFPRDPEWRDPDAPLDPPAYVTESGPLLASSLPLASSLTFREPQPPLARLETSPSVRFVVVGEDGEPLLTVDAEERTMTVHDALRVDEAAQRFVDAVQLLLRQEAGR